MESRAAAATPNTIASMERRQCVMDMSSSLKFSIPDVCIDERRLPLFIARATLRGLIAVLEARATGDAAR